MGACMQSIPTELRFLPVTIAKAIRPEDVEHAESGDFMSALLEQAGAVPQEHDILAISSKVASFVDGGLVDLAEVVPTRKAKVLAWLFGRDPRKTQLVLEQGKVMFVVPMRRIIHIPALRRMMERRTGDPRVMVRGYEVNNAFTFVVRKHAAYMDEAGIDHTNSPGDYVTLLPEDPCRLAREIRDGVRRRFGVDVGVILTDTVTCVGRVGSQDLAIGYSGIDPITRETFSLDLFGVPRSGGIDLVIDSLAGTAGLIMGQTTQKTPIVIIRGLPHQPERPDELPGMEAVAWPAGTEWKFALLTLLSTMKLWIGNLVAFQPRVRVSRVRPQGVHR